MVTVGRAPTHNPVILVQSALDEAEGGCHTNLLALLLPFCSALFLRKLREGIRLQRSKLTTPPHHECLELTISHCTHHWFLSCLFRAYLFLWGASIFQLLNINFGFTQSQYGTIIDLIKPATTTNYARSQRTLVKSNYNVLYIGHVTYMLFLMMANKTKRIETEKENFGIKAGDVIGAKRWLLYEQL